MNKDGDRIFQILGFDNRVTILQKHESVESYECMIETLDWYKMMFLKNIERLKNKELKDDAK